MAKSIADLRANPTTARAERSETICLAPNLVARVVALTEKLTMVVAPPLDDDGEPTGPPRKMGQGLEPAQRKIRTDLAAALAEMAEHEGEIILRATTDGEWRNWVNAHPARKEDGPGYDRDQEVTFGYCNADDLIDDLGKYAYSWDGDRLADGDWAILAGSIAGPDKKRLASVVTSMFESRLDFRGWRQGLQETLTGLTALPSPAPSE